MKIYNAKDIIEANRIVAYLRENGISAYCYDSNSGAHTHMVQGFGLFGVDIFADDREAERARKLMEEMDK